MEPDFSKLFLRKKHVSEDFIVLLWPLYTVLARLQHTELHAVMFKA
jgi:hypothetical protein